MDKFKENQFLCHIRLNGQTWRWRDMLLLFFITKIASRTGLTLNYGVSTRRWVYLLSLGTTVSAATTITVFGSHLCLSTKLFNSFSQILPISRACSQLKNKIYPTSTHRETWVTAATRNTNTHRPSQQSPTTGH